MDSFSAGRARDDVLRILLCCALIAAQGCAAGLSLDRKWIEVQSQNFTITSDMRADETEELARSLELFRASVLVLTNVPSLESSVPTRVFFFDGMLSFRPFQPGRNVAGFFQQTMRGNVIAMVDVNSMETDRTLRHEYVHFLMHNQSGTAYPRWYGEGFAELLSTADVSGEHVAVGQLPRDRIRQFQFTEWIPMRRILSYDGTQNWTSEEISMFYAESWALPHYLVRDRDHRTALGRVIGTYVDRVEAGASWDEACQDAFGMSAGELSKQVRRHLRRGSFTSFGVRADSLQWSDETEVRVLRPAEAAERLGELSLASGNTAKAELLFRSSLADEPDRARAHLGMGAVLQQRERWSDAEKHFARAVELDPANPLSELGYGEYWAARARKIGDPEIKRGFLRRARRHIVRSYKLDDSKPEPYAMYGATFLEDGEDPSKGVETLEHARRLLPSNTGIQLMLAGAYVAVGREEDARPLLARILAWSHDDATANGARALLKQIDRIPPTGDSPPATRTDAE